MTTVYTVGHGAREIDVFLELLQGAGIRRLVDVRTAPGSKRHPHFGRDALEVSLRSRDIEYLWRGADLGGFRRARPDSRHVSLRVDGFRGYADHMESEAFRAARAELISLADEMPTAAMCAESVWWRCHRRMLSDALVTAGCEVLHVMDRGKLDPHRLMRAARQEGDLPVYDVPEDDDGQRRLLG